MELIFPHETDLKHVRDLQHPPHAWDSGSLMKEPPVRCTQQIVSNPLPGKPQNDQLMKLWRMARRIAGKDARSWAGRAAGDRRQQT